MGGARRAALVAIGLGALAACTPSKLPEGEHLGLVAKRQTVELQPAGTKAYAWTVKLDGGRRMTVVQAEPMFAIGERVKVVTEDGRARMQIP